MTKRNRRTRAEMDSLRVALFQILANDHPMTVRQVYYQMVSRQFIEKTEANYKNIVCRLLADMRKQKIIPYNWIADNTRWQRKPDTYSSLSQMLESSIKFYRRALWDDQPVYVEIWCEKDALAGILNEETDKYDVPLMVSRGFASLSYLASAAEAILYKNKPAYLYYFGDWDPSGLMIDRNIEMRLREMAPGAEIHFERIAVTPEQIEKYNLPTRPTKTGGTHSRSFTGDSVELDAIPARELRALVRNCIEQHIDQAIKERTEEIEEAERRSLADIVERWEAA